MLEAMVESLENANGPNDVATPETSSELLPRKLYLAEILLLPFFWFAPLLLLALGGLMAKDAGRLSDEFGVELGDLRYLWYLSTFTLGHIGSVAYRAYRRRQLLKNRGIESSAATRLLKEEYNSQNLVLVGWFVLQILLFVVLAALTASLSAVIDLVAATFLLTVALNLLVGPVLVWWDLRRILRVDSVEWGWTRYLLILSAALPLGSVFYLVQRLEHLHYALLCDIWTMDPDELQIEEAEKTRLETFSDRMNERFSL